MNVAIEILENSLKQAKEQEIIIRARIDKNKNVDINKKNLQENDLEIDSIMDAISLLKRASR